MQRERMLINDDYFFQLFTGFYDTTTGPKTDSSSYTKIAEDIEAQPDEILFLTDNPDGNFLFLIYVQVFTVKLGRLWPYGSHQFCS